MSFDYFLSVTEVAGDDVSAEQVERIADRYVWASTYCQDKRVLEVACGTGQGLGLLASVAADLAAGDISAAMVERARAHYGDRVSISVFGAESLPFEDGSRDVVLISEALYYVEDVGGFLRECRRVLAPGGHLLIVTANKDLEDFNPSPYSVAYHGVRELTDMLVGAGFDVAFFGSTAVSRSGFKQRALRTAKQLAVRYRLMPRTMAGKKLLKRLVFGELVPMPAEVRPEMASATRPQPLRSGVANTDYKVIMCAASVRGVLDQGA